MKVYKYISLLGLSFSAMTVSANKWNGCYAGIHAGTAEVDNRFVTTYFAEEEYNDDLGSVEGDGEFFGVQAGCRMQFNNNWLIGARISASHGDTHAKHLYINGTGPTNFVSYQSDDLITLTGQLGFLISDKSLLYMNLGFGQIEMLIEDTDPNYQRPIYFQHKKTQRDLLLGVGYEYRFNRHWSLFAEYNQIDFGTDRGVVLNDLSDWEIHDYTADISHDMDYFKLAVNFSF
ncbi:outer membrane protein [Marinicella gelatinilytica]|uniref:outer membrane protein n=1 Tax=Marinicella gelatinilytica TaxID=2996017 RepID=UPI00226101E9|nr:outer membrane beta-barrel protein [Marinicella gelatinilytica]MCX7546238.1 outer membrane beta-barrel protein [Marinicella gelatinilytica]